ncbi:MAG: class I SAM-dependent methyltransferase [Bacteroidetes bacterium]|nr:class I SAM-dependent methyltransferase [Bacteroidota bacterium]
MLLELDRPLAHTRYEFQLQLANPINVHRLEFDMVPEYARVLDVGCHTGILGEALAQHKQAHVIGIDADSVALAQAAKRLAGVALVDLWQPGWEAEVEAMGWTRFDTIIFGDVLEHTPHPDRVLRAARTLLAPRGNIIVSLPNIAYWRIRLGLLRGNFDYTDSGILDRTHLKFFTASSARTLIEEAGYRITRHEISGFTLPPALIRCFPRLLGFQNVFEAVIT